MNVTEKSTCSETTRTGKERTFANITNEFNKHIDEYCYKPGITVKPTSLSEKGLLSNSDYQFDQFERENKIPDCVFLEIIDKISDKMHNRAVRNAKIAYYPNMTLIEFAKKFHIELD